MGLSIIDRCPENLSGDQWSLLGCYSLGDKNMEGLTRAGLALILGMSLSPSEAGSQTALSRFELVPMAGIQTGGSLGSVTDGPLGPGDLRIPGGGAYGLTLDFRVQPDGQAEFIYWRQNSRLEISNPGVPTETLFDMSVEYFHVGGLLHFQPGWAHPFAIASLGGTRFNPLGRKDLSDEWRFSFALGGGAKKYLSSRVGLRAQARLWMTLLQSDSSFFCVLPGGCLVSISGDVMFQAEFSGGLVIAF
jgi:hypothetical protein